MISKNQPKVLLTFLLITLFMSQGCARNVQIATPLAAFTVTKTATLRTTKTLTPKPTSTDTPTPDDVATADFIETASINTIISTVQPLALAKYSSPDGKWRVEVIRYDCINYPYQDYIGIIAYEQLKIVNLSDGTEKIVDDQLQNCDGIGGGGLNGLYWSPNNRYFYYSDWREGYPETCGNYVVPAIYRLDTISKETIMVGGGHIAPDKTKLAMWQGNEIVIWDLDKGEVGRVQGIAPNTVNGGIAWSPDGQSLVYLQTTFDCAPDYGNTYVIQLDLVTMSQRLLIKYGAPGFGGLSWDTPDQITLSDGEGKFWAHNPATKETVFLGASALTPTPVPPGVFALKFYPPLIMNYDPSVWKDESHYTDFNFMVNYLQSRKLKTCIIGVQGPTDFNGTPPAFIPVQLGNVKYSTIFWGESSDGSISAWYIEEQSLTGYDYAPGLPILAIQASSSEWEECKVSVEKVLSTLRVP